MERIYNDISPETAKTMDRLYAGFMKKTRPGPLTDYSIRREKKIKKPDYKRISPKNLTFLISIFIAAILTVFMSKTMPYLFDNGTREKNNEILSKKIEQPHKNITKHTGFPVDLEKLFPGDKLKNAPVDRVKLIGIIRLKNDSRAFIKDFAGNIYLVRKGTVMGRDLYMITRILKDKIIIEKKDDSGKIIELIME